MVVWFACEVIGIATFLRMTYVDWRVWDCHYELQISWHRYQDTVVETVVKYRERETTLVYTITLGEINTVIMVSVGAEKHLLNTDTASYDQTCPYH